VICLTGGVGLVGYGLSRGTAQTKRVSSGQDLDIELRNNARIYIMAGSMKHGTEVTFRVTKPENIDLFIPESLIINEIYEVTADEWGSDLEAIISLPIMASNISNQDLSEYSIAYYDDGNWVRLPSSIESTNQIISATTRHFSFFTVLKRIGNKPPETYVSTTPKIYPDLGVEQRMSTDLLSDLKVDIFVQDQENEPVTVFVAFGLETIDGDVTFGLNRFRELFGKMAEVSSGDILDPTNVVVDMGIGEFVSITAPQAHRNIATTDYYQIRENSKNHFAISFPNNININLASPLKRVFVFVKVFDSIQEDPVEITKTISVIPDKILSPARLLTPKPNYPSFTVCPPRPIFSWVWGSGVSDLKSFRFQISRGFELWNVWNPTIKWECNTSSCTNNGPEDYTQQRWQPSKDLPDGYYTWGIANSASTIVDIDTETTSFSDEWNFHIDSRLKGDSCIYVEGTDDLNNYLNQQNATATYTPNPTATSTYTPKPSKTPTETPRPTKTFTPKPTKTDTPKPTKTKTPVPQYPTHYADKNYNCREGPGSNYKHVADILKGETHRIIARASNGWVAISIDYSYTSQKYCWIGGGLVSGDLSTVEYYEVPTPALLPIYDFHSRSIIGYMSCYDASNYNYWTTELLPVDGGTLIYYSTVQLYGSNYAGFYWSHGYSICGWRN